jgi:hypothetical protein
VNRRDLNDGAARRNQPVKPLAGRQTSNGSGGGIAGTDAGHGFEVLPHEVYIERGPEGLQARFVNVYAGAQEGLLGAENDYASIYELLPVDAGDDAQHGVIK